MPSISFITACTFKFHFYVGLYMIHSGWFLFAGIHVQVWHFPWTVEGPWCRSQGLQDPSFCWGGYCLWRRFVAILFSFITWFVSITIKRMSHLGTLGRSCGVMLVLGTLLSPLVFSLTRTRLQFTWRCNLFQMFEAKRHLFFTGSYCFICLHLAGWC
jgi:hypothetical protein